MTREIANSDPSHLTTSTCSSIHACDCDCLSATTYQPGTDRKCETTKLSRSFQSNKRLSLFQICTDTRPYLALAIKPRSRSRKACGEQAFCLEHSRRCSIESPRRKKVFLCSCKLHRADASKTFVSPFRKQLFVLWEPREFGECGDRSAFGDV